MFFWRFVPIPSIVNVIHIKHICYGNDIISYIYFPYIYTYTYITYYTYIHVHIPYIYIYAFEIIEIS